MEEVFVVATIITLSFCLSKFIETKYFTEETKPLKDTVRDCLLVMMCSKSNTSKTHQTRMRVLHIFIFRTCRSLF